MKLPRAGLMRRIETVFARSMVRHDDEGANLEIACSEMIRVLVRLYQ